MATALEAQSKSDLMTFFDVLLDNKYTIIRALDTTEYLNVAFLNTLKMSNIINNIINAEILTTNRITHNYKFTFNAFSHQKTFNIDFTTVEKDDKTMTTFFIYCDDKVSIEFNVDTFVMSDMISFMCSCLRA